MAKIDYQYYGLSWDNYLVQNKFQRADFGSRVEFTYKDFQYGSSLILQSVSKPEYIKYYAEIDVQYSIKDLIKLKQQVSKLGSEYKYFGYIVPGNSFSILGLKEVTPYSGYNYTEIEQNVIAGINLKPINGAFIKLEYNKDIASGSSEQIDLQVGYSF